MLVLSIRYLRRELHQIKNLIDAEIGELCRRVIALLLVYSTVAATMPVRADGMAISGERRPEVHLGYRSASAIPQTEVAGALPTNAIDKIAITRSSKSATDNLDLHSPELLASSSSAGLLRNALRSQSQDISNSPPIVPSRLSDVVRLGHVDLFGLHDNGPTLPIPDLLAGLNFDGFLSSLNNPPTNSILTDANISLPVLPSLRSGFAKVYASTAGGSIGVFGPERYDRTTGSPNEYSATFSLPVGAASPFLLIVQNGDASGTNRVSSGWVYINGTQVVGPSDFNQNVATITRTVTLTSQNTLQVTLASKPGSYIIINIGGTNPAPTANAGPNQTVFAGKTVQLNGTGSTDSSGLPLSYSWLLTSRPSGSTATLSGANTATPTFLADKAGIYNAQLVVNNGYTSSSPSTVTITAQTSTPIANAGSPQTVYVGSTVQLDGSGVLMVTVDGVLFVKASFTIS
jgi:hypothetical protein